MIPLLLLALSVCLSHSIPPDTYRKKRESLDVDPKLADIIKDLNIIEEFVPTASPNTISKKIEEDTKPEPKLDLDPKLADILKNQNNVVDYPSPKQNDIENQSDRNISNLTTVAPEMVLRMTLSNTEHTQPLISNKVSEIEDNRITSTHKPEKPSLPMIVVNVDQVIGRDLLVPDFRAGTEEPLSTDYSIEKCSFPDPDIKKEGRRVSDIQCEYNMLKYKYEVIDNELEKCLSDDGEPISGIVGGSGASQGDFPHMGAVGWENINKTFSSYSFLCGSSLISEYFAVTAAHCRGVTADDAAAKGLMNTNPVIVRFGNVFINESYIDSDNFEDIRIDKVLTLAKYNPVTKYNDIALIRLQQKVAYQKNVRPACLWPGGHFDYKTANVSGWGQTSTLKGSESQHLRYAEVDFFDLDDCRNNLRPWYNRNFKSVFEYQFCAGKSEGRTDTCGGDSGGPIQVLKEMPQAFGGIGSLHYILGVTSFGVKCALANLPGVYTNVTDHNILCWIEKTVWPELKNTFCPKELFRGYDLPANGLSNNIV